MNDIVEELRRRTTGNVLLSMPPQFEKDRLCQQAADEIERLRKYEQLVQYIANDYWELSHDKIKWIYTDYKKRCRKLIEEDNE